MISNADAVIYCTTTWWAAVTLDIGATTPTDQQAEKLAENNLSARITGNRLTIELEVVATDVAEAATIAVVSARSDYRDAFGDEADATAIRVLARTDRDHELQHPHVPALLGIADIAAMFDITRQRAHQLAERVDFPVPVNVIGTAKIYLREQVEEFAQQWDRSSGRPPVE